MEYRNNGDSVKGERILVEFGKNGEVDKFNKQHLVPGSSKDKRQSTKFTDKDGVSCTVEKALKLKQIKL